MIVLDTHVLIWWVNGCEKLSSKAKRLVNRHRKEERGILVSSISAWEIAVLIGKGRLILSMDVASWLQETAKIPALNFIPIDNEVAVKSTQLPGTFHKDPADRMIVSLARHFSVPLITADKKILAYPHVKTVW
ncbi:MAG: type II toxin-antitoxin system VapC family toxin [Gammaproteobacteria bacterium]|nr:MAG: type II toxin-antitoxin system VapC family toxin [Gammaproteobacteria bacterium]